MFLWTTAAEQECASALYGTVPLGDYRLRIYRPTSPADEVNKFYYAPLALMEHTSAKATRNGLTGQNEMSFKVLMWTDELQELVAGYLSNVTRWTVDPDSISVYPFDQLAIQCLD